MIILKSVENYRDLKKFVKYPFILYKGCKFWIPPVIASEMNFLDRSKNPIFDSAQAHYFIAYRYGRPVGRIAILINELETRETPVARFGWFDFEDDLDVSMALINKAFEVAKQYNLKFIEGPMGFTSFDKAGILTEGFEEQGSIHSQFNYPYYQDHFRRMGFNVSSERVELKIQTVDVGGSDKFKRLSERILQSQGVRLLQLKSAKDIAPYVNEIFGVFNESYKKLHGFTRIEINQMEFYKNHYMSYLHPEYINVLLDSSDRVVAFAFLMPDISEVIKKSKGKLLPIWALRLLRARRGHDTLNTLLVGVHPDYQKTGVGAVMYLNVYEKVINNNIKQIIVSPIESNNQASLSMWKDYNPQIYRKRAVYKKEVL